MKNITDRGEILLFVQKVLGIFGDTNLCHGKLDLR